MKHDVWKWSHGIVAAMVVSAIGHEMEAQDHASLASVRVAEYPQVVTAQTTGQRRPTGTVLDAPVQLNVSDTRLEDVLETLGRQAKLKIVYSGDIVPLNRSVTSDAGRTTLGDALRRVLSGTNARIRVTTGNNIVLVPGNGSGSRMSDRAIVGRVVNAKTKQPIAGAVVSVGDDRRGIATKNDGTFRIPLEPGEHEITARAVGMLKKTITVTVQPNQDATVEIVLEQNANVLAEVTVTGTVIATERKAIPTPITVVTAEDIERRGVTNMEQLFRGEIPGLLVLEQGTMKYASSGNIHDAVEDNQWKQGTSRIYSRGAGDLTGGDNPIKTYVDGVELLDPSYLATIDPSSIERIEIVTGPQAATIYGSGALGGVMQIFTKKGAGAQAIDISATVLYGILQSNFSNKLTPVHSQLVSLRGGVGSDFSYSLSATHNYTGQWMPALFSRRYGATAGATHAHGPLTVTASFSTTNGSNGTYRTVFTNYLGFGRKTSNGEWWYGQGNMAGGMLNNQVSKTSNQTMSISADFRQSASLAHHVTIGRSQNHFALEPSGPSYNNLSRIGADTLWRTSTSTGWRTNAGYNTSYVMPGNSWVSSTFVLGATASSGKRTGTDGCLSTSTSSALLGCLSGGAPSVTTTLSDRILGTYGSWQFGLVDQFFVTLGIRGDKRSSAYRNKMKWTPTNGVTYTFEYRDLSIKLLGSYGRATRQILDTYRDEVLSTSAFYTPVQYVSQLENVELTPEFSRGPQGGIEIYWGSRGSLTVNHYQQKITDLVQRVIKDSLTRIYVPSQTRYKTYQYQYQNVASIRQKGWEGTVSLNIWALNIKGTYSWNDSRVIAVNPRASVRYQPGELLGTQPTHFGNVNIAYAHGPTSINVLTNWIGSTVDPYDYSWFDDMYYDRLRSYADSYKGYNAVAMRRSDYAKSDIVVAHTLSKNASLNIKVQNAGNSFASDMGALNPSLGRQTSFGLTVRWP